MFQVEHPAHLNPAPMYRHRQFDSIADATAWADEASKNTGASWTVYELVPRHTPQADPARAAQMARLLREAHQGA